MKVCKSPEKSLPVIRILNVSPEDVLLFSHSHSMLCPSFFFVWLWWVLGVVAPLFNKVARLMSVSFPITGYDPSHLLKPGQAISASTRSCFFSSVIKNEQIFQDFIQLFLSCHTVSC